MVGANCNALSMPKALFSLALGYLILVGNACAESPQLIRVGVLSFGTVNWEIDTLKHHKLDQKRNITVEPVKLTTKNAAAIALQSGAVDVILNDLFWVIKQQGKFQFAPTHQLTGGVYVSNSLIQNSGSRVQDIAQLGVAGGPNDKNLLLFKAYSNALGEPLPQDIQFAAPPLLNEMLVQSKVQGAINFWHYNARLESKGYSNILSTQTMLKHLQVGEHVPLLGWVFSKQFAQSSGVILQAFLDASTEAKGIMVGSEEEWFRLRPHMKTKTEKEFVALKRHYPKTLLPTNSLGNRVEHQQAAQKLFDLVKTLPGQTMFYPDTKFPDELFYQPEGEGTLSLSQLED